MADPKLEIPPVAMPDQYGPDGKPDFWAMPNLDGWVGSREMGERWNPSKHPRWPKGTPKAGKFMTKGEITARLTRGVLRRREQMSASETLPAFKDPNSPDAIDCGKDVEKAVRLLGEGKAVRLEQPRQLSVLLERLAEIAKEAEARGETAPKYDLCKVTVKDTSLFCAGSTILGRALMPQLKSATPKRGSRAAKKERNQFGEADITDDFVAYLKDKKIGMREEMEHAAYLKATQNELNGVKVGNIMRYFRAHPEVKTGEGPLLVTREGYILDGHHRWAALVGLDSEDGRLGDDKQIPIVRIDISVTELLYHALKFTIDEGIAPAGFSQGTGRG